MQFVRASGSVVALAGLLIGGSIAASACGGSDATSASSSQAASSSSSSTSTSSSGAGGAGGGGGAGGAGGTPILKSKTIEGDATWNATFDATAKAAGATDCSYTRHYKGVEDESARWYCPTCDAIYAVDVTMPMGEKDCYSQFSSNPFPKKEWLGYANGKWFRGFGATMNELGTADVTATDVTWMNSSLMQKDPAGMLFGGGSWDFQTSGKLTLGEIDGDPLHGFEAPQKYMCGWPKSDAPPYTGDYVLKKGAMLPDGILDDTCGEAVRFHDFKGEYLVVEMSARDCPPCQQMAKGEEAFVADMAAQGITVHILTLLAPSLSDVLGDTTPAMLKTWTKNYKLMSPVLADRGWGVSEFEPAIPMGSLGYPSWVIVDPNLNVVDFNSGFGSWDDFKTAIIANKK
jgi:hypothetical protein